MADKNDGGDKTEQPTSKKLQDARKKGQVAKSRDLSSTASLLAWLGVLVLGGTYVATELMALMDAALASLRQPFAIAAPALGSLAWRTGLLVTVLAVLPAAAVGVLAEFLQAGPIFSGDKLKPKGEHLNPVEGIKRMFTMDNLVEVLKSLAKTAILLFIGWLVLRAMLPSAARLFDTPAGAGALYSLFADITRQMLVWTLVTFFLIAALDAAYQRYAFIKKMRMSLRDIKQESKEAEGDPHVKQQRKQSQQEWSQRNAQQAARQAHVLVVNPTHVAIAIEYDRDTCPVPTVSAKGEDHVARAMREAAEEAGVPIVRNVPLARDLLGRGEVGELVPADLFDIIAEVILWAREVRQSLEAGEEAPARVTPPGEDLTRYGRAGHEGPAR